MRVITVRINGEPQRLAEGTDVWTLVAEQVGRVEGVAVARNDAVVPRSQWSATYVRHGDRVELLVAAQGG